VGRQPHSLEGQGDDLYAIGVIHGMFFLVSNGLRVSVTPLRLVAGLPTSESAGQRDALPSLVPEQVAAAKRQVVAPRAAAWWHLVQLVDVASTNDDIVELKRGYELRDDLADAAPPFLDAHPF